MRKTAWKFEFQLDPFLVLQLRKEATKDWTSFLSSNDPILDVRMPGEPERLVGTEIIGVSEVEPCEENRVVKIFLKFKVKDFSTREEQEQYEARMIKMKTEFAEFFNGKRMTKSLPLEIMVFIDEWLGKRI